MWSVNKMDEVKYKNISVLFEDNHVIVAIKPVGVLSQADGSSAPDMLTILKEYIKVTYNKPGNVFLGLLHRLDRNVEGVMVFAKTSKAASRISEQIRKHEVNKRYRAVINGIPKKENSTLINYCVKDSRTNTTKVYDKRPHSGDIKESVLNYNIISKSKFNGIDVSLIDVELITGRSHQIRAQMSHLGHPLLGDSKYGDRTFTGPVSLQSYLIGFKHPVTSEYMEFTLPEKTSKPWNVFGGLK